MTNATMNAQYTATATKRPVRTPAHPAQEAVNSIIKQYEGKYPLTAQFVLDEESMALFKRSNSVVVAFICSIFDENEKCISRGRGLSFASYENGGHIQRQILYARNASMIDSVARASRLSTIFAGDDKENGEYASSPRSHAITQQNKPSEKQVRYLRSLIETLPGDEQTELLTQLPTMNRYDVSQLINKLKD